MLLNLEKLFNDYAQHGEMAAAFYQHSLNTLLESIWNTLDDASSAERTVFPNGSIFDLLKEIKQRIERLPEEKQIGEAEKNAPGGTGDALPDKLNTPDASLTLTLNASSPGPHFGHKSPTLRNLLAEGQPPQIHNATRPVEGAPVNGLPEDYTDQASLFFFSPDVYDTSLEVLDELQEYARQLIDTKDEHIRIFIHEAGMVLQQLREDTRRHGNRLEVAEECARVLARLWRPPDDQKAFRLVLRPDRWNLILAREEMHRVMPDELDVPDRLKVIQYVRANNVWMPQEVILEPGIEWKNKNDRVAPHQGKVCVLTEEEVRRIHKKSKVVSS